MVRKAGHEGHPLQRRSTRPQRRERVTAPVGRQLREWTSHGCRQAKGDRLPCQPRHAATRRKNSTPPGRGPWHRDTVIGAASQPSSSSIEEAMAVHLAWREGEVILTRKRVPYLASARGCRTSPAHVCPERHAGAWRPRKRGEDMRNSDQNATWKGPNGAGPHSPACAHSTVWAAGEQTRAQRR